MSQEIEETNAFKALSSVSQIILRKKESRDQIADAVVQARTMGVEVWKKQTPIPIKWQKIVEELI